MADCRIALCLARGLPIDEIDAVRGYDLSERAYREVRDRWLEEADAHPDSDWLRTRYQHAFESWARHRPDLVGDWPEWADATERSEGR
ncbi:hypothetical protein [Streptomyces sp. NPDC007083]|uniref:hypothetical protein n=1 Tax=Streptomyces sp. NPDC007083 TaxID=3156913 RepID=UPI0033E2F0EC